MWTTVVILLGHFFFFLNKYGIITFKILYLQRNGKGPAFLTTDWKTFSQSSGGRWGHSTLDVLSLWVLQPVLNVDFFVLLGFAIFPLLADFLWHLLFFTWDNKVPAVLWRSVLLPWSKSFMWDEVRAVEVLFLFKVTFTLWHLQSNGKALKTKIKTNI